VEEILGEEGERENWIRNLEDLWGERKRVWGSDSMNDEG